MRGEEMSKNMKIQVKKNVFIESDNHQFMIREYSDKPSINKDGEEFYPFRTLGYYGSLEHLVNGLVRREILESDATSVNELLDEMKRIRLDISRLLRGEGNHAKSI